ncbi:FAD-dependent oxidoreductase [Halosimplex halophilum]|uniref:FAD-dependent oxidoreductase n=1 Tax=Halosimplex halophilum TaxID=2559572 RepID=UPI00107F3D2A|nr:FAD-dependent oxidoreductase [Halosimplex halophilum]
MSDAEIDADTDAGADRIDLDSRETATPDYDGAFDAVVVGAGLAGSTAALTMAENGLDVLMVERGRFPGAKNVFGGVLYTPTLRELVDIESAPLERYIAERRFGMLTDDDETAVSLSPGEWHEPPHNDSYTVRRGEFDEWLAEQAVGAGATLVCRTTVTDLLREDGRVVGVETDRPDGTVRAPYVVLAEGGNSLVSERADLKAPERRENVAVGVKEVLEFPDREHAIADRFRVSGDAGASYHYFGEGAVGDAFGGGFVYTNEDTVSVGLAYRLSDAATGQPDPEATLDGFKTHPAVAPLLRGARTVEYTAKTIPEGGAEAIPQLVHDGAVLVGDTAGLVLNNGLHLEGTNMAVESGYHAGKAVADAVQRGRTDADALAGYREALESSFVVRNLDRYEWLIERVQEDRQLLFEELPRAVADAGSEYFRMDRAPKDDHAATAKRELLQAVGGYTGAAKLAVRYRNLL